MTLPPDGSHPALHLSVIAPAHNEEENIENLVTEVENACRGLDGPWEFVIVNDGSTDTTESRLRSLMHTRPWLRCIRMTNTPPGRGNGQSAAFHSGFRACRGGMIAVLDADLQNDPAEIPRMVELLRTQNADMVQGDRSHARKDNFIRRIGSIIGRLFRRMILGDSIRDTGCSLRVMKREIAISLPLEFAGMHRFIPVGARQLGYKVIEMPVKHRPRAAGTTKYGLGITKRAIPGLIDCFAVRWMARRRRPIAGVEVTATSTEPFAEPPRAAAAPRAAHQQMDPATAHAR
ncbi:MAG: glycosyltransferase family 2 protein [Phycisphaerales bacterium]|nr:glycosyltransferase family 2 protein [Phycisphaerales bacterium]